MIPIEVTFFMFFILALFTESKTYFILATFSLLNVYVYPYTSPDNPNLLDIYASIDFFACIAVLLFGDIHKIYQSFILAIMVFCHGLMEQALNFDFYYDVTSQFYEGTIVLLLIAQMMGVFYGIDNVPNPHFDIWKIRNSSGVNRKSLS